MKNFDFQLNFFLALKHSTQAYLNLLWWLHLRYVREGKSTELDSGPYFQIYWYPKNVRELVVQLTKHVVARENQRLRWKNVWEVVSLELNMWLLGKINGCYGKNVREVVGLDLNMRLLGKIGSVAMEKLCRKSFIQFRSKHMVHRGKSTVAMENFTKNIENHPFGQEIIQEDHPHVSYRFIHPESLFHAYSGLY